MRAPPKLGVPGEARAVPGQLGAPRALLRGLQCFSVFKVFLNVRTLLNALIYHNENLPENSDGRPGLVHRIDKDTSGLLVIAKSQIALSSLSEQFFHKTVDRKYLAIVWGEPKPSNGIINENLSRDKKNRMIMSVPDEESIGKKAITHYEVIESFGYVSLVECVLETGRTHQIRAHMKHIGNPIFNDIR